MRWECFPEQSQESWKEFKHVKTDGSKHMGNILLDAAVDTGMRQENDQVLIYSQSYSRKVSMEAYLCVQMFRLKSKL